VDDAHRLTVCLSFDLDAVSFWTTTLRSVSPSDISRGEFGPRTAMPRILDLLAAHGVPATFFVPAVTARQFPATVHAAVAAGHEIGSHGDMHERLTGLERADEERVLRRSVEVLEDIAGTRPRGFRAPAWELSPNTIGLLEDLGIEYDSSQFATDFEPYRARRGDRVVDGEWAPGPESAVWEIPVAWELDDFPAFFLRPPHFTMGRPTEDVYRGWVDEYEYALGNAPGGVFTLTMHPEVIGRGPRLAILDRFIEHVSRRADVGFARMGAVAEALSSDQTTSSQEGI
jgi:peptidoglycan/xylan/chitin deacetylase (PgdA/CDA1 family)